MIKNSNKRKSDHIDIVLNKDVNHKKTTGLENIELNYCSLPEIDLDDVNISTEFLGKSLSAPIIISGMVGGIEKAKNINKRIAVSAQNVGIGMGLGSQRSMLKDSKLKSTYIVKDVAPDILLIGNIGIIQLKKYELETIEKMIEDVQADALAIHINAAQEAIQPEGDTNFSDCISIIDEISRELSKPVYVKEVGNGISYEVAKELAKTKIKAIDVQGVGGTSWTAIEGIRGDFEIGKTFWDFGIPTAISIYSCRKAFKGKIIASGGIRTGLDIVKSIILGADLGGFATPIIKIDNFGGVKEIEKFLNRIIREIKISCYLLGCKNIKELKNITPIITGETKKWIEEIELF